MLLELPRTCYYTYAPQDDLLYHTRRECLVPDGSKTRYIAHSLLSLSLSLLCSTTVLLRRGVTNVLLPCRLLDPATDPERIYDVKDGLPKFTNAPADFGGDGTMVDE